jgi:hypothetical protein
MGIVEEVVDHWLKSKSRVEFWSRFAYVAICIYLYVTYTSCLSRTIALTGAIGFIFFETAFTTLGNSLEHKSFKIGHTTWAQFVCNCMYIPILLCAYREVVKDQTHRILFFPINIWLLEIIQGYSLMFLCGRNIAWFYHTSDARFHGNIRLYYAFVWWPFGALVEALWDPVLMVIAETLKPIHIKLILLVPLFMVISAKFVGWPLLGIPREHQH